MNNGYGKTMYESGQINIIVRNCMDTIKSIPDESVNSEEGTVLDPFCGSGTTGIVSVRNGRRFIGLELNPEYADMSVRRINAEIKQGIQMSFA